MGNTLKSDASAAVAMASRRGLGQVRHIESIQLWLQEKVRWGYVRVVKVTTGEYVADALTTYVSSEGIRNHMRDVHQIALE